MPSRVSLAIQAVPPNRYVFMLTVRPPRFHSATKNLSHLQRVTLQKDALARLAKTFSARASPPACCSMRKHLPLLAPLSMKRLLARCWNAWVENAGELRRQEMIVGRAASKWQSACVSKAMDTWRDWTSGEVWQKENALHVGAGIVHFAAARAFRKWKEVVSEQVKARNTTTKTISRMRHRGLARAWDVWREHALQQIRQRAHVAKAVVRLTQHVLWGALSSWKQHALEQRLQRRIVTKAVGRLRNRVLGGAFCTLWQRVKEQRHERHHFELSVE